MPISDRIIESYLKDFVTKANLQGLEENHAFEYFVNDLVIARDYPEPYDIEAVSVRGRNDLGIDGLAIVVNEHLAFSREDITFFTKQLRRLDAKFIFIQSKTSPTFDGGDIGKFLFGVRTFFTSLGIENEQLASARDLKDAIYDSSRDMDDAPKCELYYATLGKWSEDPHLNHLIDTEVSLLKSTNLFSSVEFHPLDADAIRSAYRELNRKFSKEIIFERHTNLPSIAGIEQAYIGSIPAAEYLKLICDENGRLQRSLFYDNVRDFQGNNSVNQDISTTLSNKSLRDRFIVLNNGITVVARSLNQVGPKFKLSDFQIVNGCQTSHVIFNNRLKIDKVEIPIKLIITQDSEVINSVIKATNRQTEVKEEAFESLNPFQKELEEFYEIVEKEQADFRLYYERRSKQYDHLNLDWRKIVTLTGQIKSFVAMFLNEPHSTHRYYGELMEAKRSQMFLEDHSPFPYYISARAYTTLEHLFATAKIPRRYIRFKYQVLMLFRLLCEPSNPPALNSRKAMDVYCKSLLSTLRDPSSTLRTFEKAITLLNDALTSVRTGPGPEPERLRSFTSALLSSKTEHPPAPIPIHRERGFVAEFSEIKGFGFIRNDERATRLFVHFRDIRGEGFRSLKEGELVEFTCVSTPKGLRAVDVSRSHDTNTIE